MTTLTAEDTLRPLSARAVRAGRRAVQTPEDGALLLVAALFGRDLEPPAWHADAACRGADPALFDDFRRCGQALELCSRCPVRDLCSADQNRWESAMAPASAGFSSNNERCR